MGLFDLHSAGKKTVYLETNHLASMLTWHLSKANIISEMPGMLVRTGFIVIVSKVSDEL